MDQLRIQIEAYKDKLRKGEPVSGPRSTGRTQAILEYAHETIATSNWDIAIVCATPELCEWTFQRWVELYGKNSLSPRFIHSLDQIRGQGVLKVLEDPL